MLAYDVCIDDVVYRDIVVNTKAEVRFHIDSADWIPTRVKERLKSMVGLSYYCT